jgi:hypothetical protein
MLNLKSSIAGILGKGVQLSFTIWQNVKDTWHFTAGHPIDDDPYEIWRRAKNKKRDGKG